MNDIVYGVISKRIPSRIESKVRKEGDYYVALSPIMGAFISMNILAGEIYTMIDGRRCIDDIVEEITQLYKDVPVNRIKKDICRCISDLESFNLITLVKEFRR